MDDPNSSAKGPKACSACAASKAKCIFTPDTTATNRKCNRCNRLNKHCVMQTAAVRTRRPKNTTRVAQLEEKLEILVSQLGASQQGSPAQIDNSVSAVQSLHADSLVPEQTPRGSASSQFVRSPSSHHLPQTPAPTGYQAPQTPASSNHGEQSARGINLRNPESLLDFYRDEIAEQFPFVIIPRETKAFELIQDKPFLFKNIAMVASAQDVKAQVRMAEEIVEYLSLHMLLRSEKSLDLLQGLLLFMAWFHSHVHLGRRFTTLLRLADALIVDMSLYREPISGLKLEARQQEFWTYPEDLFGSEVRTLEERRAYLGYVYLSSAISIYMDFKEPPYSTTSYAHISVNIIQQSPQYQSDQYLLQLMKLQSIAQEASEALPRENSKFFPMSSSAALSIKTLKTKLNVFESCVPIHLRSNSFLIMHYQSILVYLTESALYTPSLPSRQAILHACLTSVISFFSALFSVPIRQYFKFSYPSWLQVLHCLTTLSKLSLFESDDWDLTHVGGMMDLSLVLDGMLSRFGEVVTMRQMMAGRGTVSEPDMSDGILGRTIPRIREYKAAFERRRAEILQRGEQRTVAVPQMTFSGPHDSQINMMTATMLPDQAYDSMMQFDQFDMPPVNFSQLDNAFWQEFIGDYSII